jgi:hypothetical protein
MHLSDGREADLSDRKRDEGFCGIDAEDGDAILDMDKLMQKSRDRRCVLTVVWVTVGTAMGRWRVPDLCVFRGGSLGDLELEASLGAWAIWRLSGLDWLGWVGRGRGRETGGGRSSGDLCE